MARKIVPKRHGRSSVESNAPLTVTIEGGMPGHEHLDTRLEVVNDNGQTRRLRILGGLPSELAGERMTAAERAEYDNRTYKAIFGGDSNYLLTAVQPKE